MSEAISPEQFKRVCSERDLYLRLLDLNREQELMPLLRMALQTVVELAGARQGYLELFDETDRQTPRWWIAHGFADAEIEPLRRALSRGIIAEALATGQTIVTASAIEDQRFADRESVRSGGIQAVLCAPIGAEPACGALYLQGRMQRGPFGDDDKARCELFACQLGPLVDRLLRQQQAQESADPTRTYRGSLRLDGMVGRSRPLAQVFKQAALVAPLNVTVLLTGDSGTGKSQLARIIHDNSPRAGQPFVELNCAALPETLVESELFGAVAGAHSTATRKLDGKVAAADKGTLFLDEIGELSLATQAKLLQLLQAKTYYPLGSPKAVLADVRLIAATNADLQSAVAEKRFREDLLYRLHVMPIRMPTLAERREDITPLAEHLCELACERYGLPRLTLSRNALRALDVAEWPGNVRQLANVVDAAAIRCAGEGALQIQRQHLFPDATPMPESAEEEKTLTFQEATRNFQAQLLRDTLQETGWNIMETARRLDLNRSHIYNLIRAFGFERADESVG